MKVPVRSIFILLLLYVWIGVSALAVLFIEPRERLKLQLEERLTRVHNRHNELDDILRALQYLDKKVNNNAAGILSLECQQDILMAASRVGWRHAERLIGTGFMQVCRGR